MNWHPITSGTISKCFISWFSAAMLEISGLKALLVEEQKARCFKTRNMWAVSFFQSYDCAPPTYVSFRFAQVGEHQNHF
jgi:hypothetical protein